MDVSSGNPSSDGKKNKVTGQCHAAADGDASAAEVAALCHLVRSLEARLAVLEQQQQQGSLATSDRDNASATTTQPNNPGILSKGPVFSREATATPQQTAATATAAVPKAEAPDASARVAAAATLAPAQDVSAVQPGRGLPGDVNGTTVGGAVPMAATRVCMVGVMVFAQCLRTAGLLGSCRVREVVMSIVGAFPHQHFNCNLPR
jgi:hypothetical protein